jgi:hypothetical protein
MELLAGFTAFCFISMNLLLRVRNLGIAAATPSLTAGQIEVYPLQKAGNKRSRGIR